jgi:hypothetical protein
MTTRIALLIAVAVGALAIVPTVLAKGRLAGSTEDAVAHFYANESATLTFGSVVHDHGDATQAKLVLQSLLARETARRSSVNRFRSSATM